MMVPKYSRRETEAWTLSSTALGWGLTGVAILLVVFFGAGFYVGYNWGFDQGEQLVRDERPELPEDELAALLEEGDTGLNELEVESETSGTSDTSGTTESAASDSGRESQEGLTEEELGLSLTGEEDTVEESAESEETTGLGEQVSEETVDREQTPGLVSESEEEQPEDSEPSAAMSDLEAEEENTSGGNDQSSPGDSSTETEQQSQFYVIQVSSSEKRSSANSLAEELRDLDYLAQVVETNVEGDTWFRVRVGEYPSREQAKEAADKMVEKGDIDSYWISYVRRR